MKHSLHGVFCRWATVALVLGMSAGPLRAADDSDTFTRALAYTNEVYSKNHMTVLTDVEWTKGTKQSFRYDRYPEVERVQQENVSYARKTGGTWLKSEDWAKTGKKIGADKSAELDGLVSIVAAALHKNLTPPGAERSIAEIVERRPKDGYEWVIFETRKEKTVTMAHPQFVFTVHGKDEQGMLIGYAGFQRMGDRDLRANLNFSVLFPIKIVESTPAPGARKDADTAGTPPSVPPQNPPPDATAPAAPAALPAPEKEKVYNFTELTLHGKDLVGKVVQVEIAPKPVKRRTDLHNGLYQVTLFDTNPSMPTFGFVNCPDEGLKKLGLEDGSAKKSQMIYLLIGKEKLSGIAKFTAIGTHFEAGKEGTGTYSW